MEFSELNINCSLINTDYDPVDKFEKFSLSDIEEKTLLYTNYMFKIYKAIINEKRIYSKNDCSAYDLITDYNQEINQNESQQENDAVITTCEDKYNLLKNKKIYKFGKIPIFLVQYDFFDITDINIEENLMSIYKKSSSSQYTLKKHGFCFNSNKTILYISYYRDNKSFINANMFACYEGINLNIFYADLCYRLIEIAEDMHNNNKVLFLIHPNLIFFDNTRDFPILNKEEKLCFNINNIGINKNSSFIKQNKSNTSNSLNKDESNSNIFMYNIKYTNKNDNKLKNKCQINKDKIVKENLIKNINKNSVFYLYDDIFYELYKIKWEITINNKTNIKSLPLQEMAYSSYLLNYFRVYDKYTMELLQNNNKYFFNLDVQTLLLLIASFFSESNNLSQISYERILLEHMKDYVNKNKSFSNTLKFIKNNDIKLFLENHLSLSIKLSTSITELKNNYSILYENIIYSSNCYNCKYVSNTNNNVEYNQKIINYNKDCTYTKKKLNYSCLKLICYNCSNNHIKYCKICLLFQNINVYDFFVDKFNYLNNIINLVDMSPKIITFNFQSKISESTVKNLYDIHYNINNIKDEIVVNEHKINCYLEYYQNILNKMIEKNKKEILFKFENDYKLSIKKLVNLKNKKEVNCLNKDNISLNNASVIESKETKFIENHLNQITTAEFLISNDISDLNEILDKVEIKKNYIKNLNYKDPIDKIKLYINKYLNKIELMCYSLIPNISYKIQKMLVSFFEKYNQDLITLNSCSLIENGHIILEFDNFIKYNKYIACIDYNNRVIQHYNIEKKKTTILKLSDSNYLLPGSKYVNMKTKLVVTGGCIKSTTYDKDIDENSLISKKLFYISLSSKYSTIDSFYNLKEEDDYNPEANNLISNIINNNLLSKNKHTSPVKRRTVFVDIKNDNNVSCVRNPVFLKDMKYGRERHSVIALFNIYLIVVGGFNTNTCEIYNFLKNKWSVLPSLKSNKYDTNLCLLNKVDLYLFFGCINTTNCITNRTHVNYCYEIERLKLYDNANNLDNFKYESMENNYLNTQWEQISVKYNDDLDSNIRCLPGIVQYSDNIIYIVGGKKESCNTSGFYSMKFNICNNTFTVDKTSKFSSSVFFNESTFIKINTNEYGLFCNNTKCQLIRLNY